MQLFIIDSITKDLQINEPAVLIIKELAALREIKRNKCKEDPSGKELRLAFKEYVYIYFMLDWSSPYSDLLEQERHEAALKDSGLTKTEFADSVFREACRKYRSLQESKKEYQLLLTVEDQINKLQVYLKNLDLDERDTVTNKPLFRVADVIKTLTTIPELIETFQTTKKLVMKSEEKGEVLRGDMQVGLEDIDINRFTPPEDDDF